MITPELFCEAQRMHVGKRQLWLWLFPVVPAWLTWLNLHSLALTITVAAISCTFPAIMSWLLTTQWRALQRRSPYLREPVNAVVTEEGLEFSSTVASGKLPWSLFVRIRERDRLLLLYQAPNIFTIVPRVFFQSDEAWDQAKAMIHRGIPGKARS